MREIKFRGKRIDNGQWVYGHCFKTPLTDENSGMPSDAGWFFLSGTDLWCIRSKDGAAFVVDRDTVGEFTGIKDCDDIEIYEGDLLYCWGDGFDDGDEPEKFEVIYCGHNDYPAFDLLPHVDTESNGLSYYKAVGKIKVLGTVFDKPAVAT